VMDSSAVFSTMGFNRTNTSADAKAYSNLAQKVLDTLPQAQTTQKLLRQDKPRLDDLCDKPLWMEPKTFKLPKPSTYKLTNGDIGHVKKVLQWQPEDDEDTAVLPALPLTVHEEIDAGKKLVDQVCESDAA